MNSSRRERTGGGRVRTLVIIPAYNEAESLPSTLRELRCALPDVDIVVVDDGSVDATGQVTAAAGVATLRLPFNIGVGGAVRAGLRWAVEGGHDRAVIIDADGQHDPASITTLLAMLDDGADMVVGSRFADPVAAYAVGRTRARAMRWLGRLVRVSTGRRFTDTTSGFRAFDRPVIELLAREYPVEYLADTVEVLIRVCRAGYRVDEVSVSMRPRAAGVPSTRRLRLVFNYLRLLVGIVAAISRRKPIKGDPIKGDPA